jgi:hypothetical protein
MFTAEARCGRLRFEVEVQRLPLNLDLSLAVFSVPLR